MPTTLLGHLLRVMPPIARRRVAKGQTVYRQGENDGHLFVVMSGRIGISMLRPDGQEFLIDIVGAGAICGEGAAFDGLPRFSSASALEPSEVLLIAADELCRLMSQQVEIVPLIVQAIALKQRMLAGRLNQISQASPEIRITELLSQITQADSPTIVLTHQQIANLIGTSRITVTRAMKKLRREGAVRCRRGEYELVHRAAMHS
ncbi:Crp/Fnr family transcriptional regulator [Bradyrhizobium sp. U87765 SZCCT0131]|uniref:Crp/Fnr family transcriptional regulator n=1 Tax=unclassified Bradyrhizobium TaxID=2631580 RepID=UPI001BA69D0C|nr:Crp/Fnr family transcriptional regulator [Bradyrhizobium sp. U87765 SZCCT0131]MBR1264882.1 Crp/Fnr family transcriptional regulator [Bradyrhizobium sp. U87765 SZCCT0134]MBR1304864.1 Crp/Fnr family transcriptional regulator [Bradyrhizobium sp. U87765 SZCCT0110]MBR1320651.1 Crp/Fnr family transcriptional regulator [Bradyrhizobium sp. U87765 SZCCT0109]MBR1349071.1 Crp/Fnr family transcriptional regulator [Bradyrhizobium sp. U87765 SZCCT0048]